MYMSLFFFFKQKTAYEMRISDWSSDVCSSDLDLAYNDAGVTYGDVFLENEREMSTWNFEVANTEALFDLFKKAAAECERCLDAKLPLPAYEQAIKASHVFNLLQARGVISVAERQAYIGRVRDLARKSTRLNSSP